MKNSTILKYVQKVRDDVRKNEDKLNVLLALLREEEVVSILGKRKSISVGNLQREFDMGYSTARTLIDNLLKKGYITQKGKGLDFSIVKKVK
ncbi:MAG: DNA translocase FtsK [Patescibacteria group bacterium]